MTYHSGDILSERITPERKALKEGEKIDYYFLSKLQK